jgi:uncharacterized membrane protein
MNFTTQLTTWFSSAWEVLMLFIIPIGGGIPGGVILGHQRGMPWPALMIIYFVSDVILACVFEPLMHLFVRAGKHSPLIARIHFAARESTKKTLSLYGTQLGPLALIFVSFGIDPMTGRAATAAAGHGFIVGWLLAITGDMFYFAVIMICTLWLSEILGDGTWATMVILAIMLGVPIVIRRIREKYSRKEVG